MRISQRKAKKGVPIAATSKDSELVIWISDQREDGTEESHVFRMQCVSAQHATELAAAWYSAFGIRNAKNSFTTGLLLKDLEITCSL